MYIVVYSETRIVWVENTHGQDVVTIDTSKNKIKRAGSITSLPTNIKLEYKEFESIADAKNHFGSINTDLIDEMIDENNWKYPSKKVRIIIPLTDAIDEFGDMLSGLIEMCNGDYYYKNFGRLIVAYFNYIDEKDMPRVVGSKNIKIEQKP